MPESSGGPQGGEIAAADGPPTPEPPMPPTPAPEAGGGRRNAALVGAGILLSRISGLIREAAIGGFLGNGFATDAFRAALRIPNLLQNLLGEGVLSASFIPVYSRLLAQDRREEAGRVAGAIAGTIALVAALLVVLGVALAGPLTTLLVPGYTGEKHALTVTLVQILTPGLGFLALSAWCLGVLNSHRRFFLSYAAPVIWNAAAIAFLVAAALRGLAAAPMAVALSVGILVGSVLQFAVQLPGVLRLEPGLRPSLRWREPGTKRVLRAFGPVVAGRGVVQLSGYLDLVLASLLATGAVAALGFAQVLYLLPISLFGMSVAAAELPELSSDREATASALSARIDEGLARVAFFVVPTAVVYVLLGNLVVSLLYQRGAFGADDTLQVWAVLAAYSLGLLATTASRLLQNVLYAAGDPRTPAVISALRVAVSLLLGGLLMLQLDRLQLTTAGLDLIGDLPTLEPASRALRGGEDSFYRLGAVGLALAAAASAWLEYGLLRRKVRQRAGRVRLAGGRLLPTLLAAGIAGAAGMLAQALLQAAPSPVLAVGGLGIAGLVYLVAAQALGLHELRAVTDRVFRRRR